MRVSWMSSQPARRKCEAYLQGTLLGGHGKGTRPDGLPDTPSRLEQFGLHIRKGLVAEGTLTLTCPSYIPRPKFGFFPVFRSELKTSHRGPTYALRCKEEQNTKILTFSLVTETEVVPAES